MLTKSSTELVRQRNSVLVLAALRSHGALAHTEISDFTGLSSATISAITADLEKAQIIEKSEQQAASGRGRPRVLLRQRRDCGYLIVVIISSDGVQYSLVDYAGKLIDRFSEERSHDPAGAGRFVASVRDGLSRILVRSKIIQEKVLLDIDQQQGARAPHRTGVSSGRRFSAATRSISTRRCGRTGRPRSFSATRRCWLRQRSARMRRMPRPADFRSLAALSLGHSIGLGIVRRDRPGEREISAPNFGHMLHMANGGLCRCGSKGCIEAYAGFYAILRMAFEVPLDTIPAKFVPVAELDKIAAQGAAGPSHVCLCLPAGWASRSETGSRAC